MTDSNQVGMYVCLGIAAVLFLLTFYINATSQWPGSENKLSDEEITLRVKLLMVLSGIFILASGGIATKRKTKLVKRDIFNVIVMLSAVLTSWIIAWKECSEFAMGLSVLSAIFSCIALDIE
jgi:membrane-associated PAP2 superfamily phosphatase